MRPELFEQRAVAADEKRCDRRWPGGQLVRPLRDDVSHAASRVRYVTGVPRDDLHVNVRHRLPGRRTRVGADVEPVRLVLNLDERSHFLHERQEVSSFLVGGLPPVGDLAAGITSACPGVTGKPSRMAKARRLLAMYRSGGMVRNTDNARDPKSSPRTTR